jgi:excisionase family DNA binding protein
LPADWATAPRLTLVEAADLLNTSLSSIIRWTRAGCRAVVLKSYLIGGKRWIFRRDVDTFLDALQGSNHVN